MQALCPKHRNTCCPRTCSERLATAPAGGHAACLSFGRELRFREQKSLGQDKWLGAQELRLVFKSLCRKGPCFHTYPHVRKSLQKHLRPQGKGWSWNRAHWAPEDVSRRGERLVRTRVTSRLLRPALPPVRDTGPLRGAESTCLEHRPQGPELRGAAYPGASRENRKGRPEAQNRLCDPTQAQTSVRLPPGPVPPVGPEGVHLIYGLKTPAPSQIMISLFFFL